MSVHSVGQISSSVVSQAEVGLLVCLKDLPSLWKYQRYRTLALLLLYDKAGLTGVSTLQKPRAAAPIITRRSLARSGGMTLGHRHHQYYISCIVMSREGGKSGKAGLQFPVGRIHRFLKKGNHAQRISADAPGTS
jgi:hypothetical protein